jgi:hypothetical protein
VPSNESSHLMDTELIAVQEQKRVHSPDPNDYPQLDRSIDDWPDQPVERSNDDWSLAGSYASDLTDLNDPIPVVHGNQASHIDVSTVPGSTSMSAEEFREPG